MTKKKANFVDFVPSVLPGLTWEDKEGSVTLIVENKGFYNRLAQRFFKKPRFSRIELDKYGSFVFKQIDGEKDIYRIGKELEKEMPGARDKLYERLSAFMKILKNNKYIELKTKR